MSAAIFNSYSVTGVSGDSTAHATCILTRPAAVLPIISIVLFVAFNVIFSVQTVPRSHHSPFCVPEDNRYEFQVKPALRVRGSVFLPLYASHTPSTIQDSIKVALISIHGYGRHGGDTFCQVFSALEKRSDVMILVPLFHSTAISGLVWNSSDSRSSSAFWPTSNWMKGGNAHTKFTTHGLSSFAAIDMLISQLQNTTLFPSLRLVVVAGFSAGGQFVNRYSWATSRGISSNHSITPVRFVVGSCNSYLYFNSVRPHKNCSLPYNGVPSCSRFTLPYRRIRARCPKYDRWPFGLTNMSSSKFSYFQQLALNESLKGSATRALKFKDVRFLFGSEDVCNCNLRNFSNDPVICFPEDGRCRPNRYGGLGCCDTTKRTNLVVNTCGDVIQGPSRLQRGLLYMQYLSHIWSTRHKLSNGTYVVTDAFTPTYEVIPNMGHHSFPFYASKAMNRWLTV